MKMPLPTIAVSFALVFSLVAVPLAGAAPTHLMAEKPVQISTVAPGVVLVDFGKVAYGNLGLTPPAGGSHEITVHFGEALANGRLNRKPPGTVRYAAAKATLSGGKPAIVAPPADKRNTNPFSPALRTAL